MLHVLFVECSLIFMGGIPGCRLDSKPNSYEQYRDVMEPAEENLHFHTGTVGANVSHIPSAEFKFLTALFQHYLKHDLNES